MLIIVIQIITEINTEMMVQLITITITLTIAIEILNQKEILHYLYYIFEIFSRSRSVA